MSKRLIRFKATYTTKDKSKKYTNSIGFLMATTISGTLIIKGAYSGLVYTEPKENLIEYINDNHPLSKNRNKMIYPIQ